MSLADLRAALNAELTATPEYYDFKVLRSERDGAHWDDRFIGRLAL